MLYYLILEINCRSGRVPVELFEINWGQAEMSKKYFWKCFSLNYIFFPHCEWLWYYLILEINCRSGQVLAEHFENKWGQVKFFGAGPNLPLIGKRVNVSAKSNGGQISTVPLCSTRPAGDIKGATEPLGIVEMPSN